MLGIAKLSFCFVSLVFSFLTQIPLFSVNFANFQFETFNYSPTFLLVFVLSLLFKNNYAFIALVTILILVAFGIPLFSFGGGWQYIMQPSFGYILAMIFMSVTVFYFYYHMEDDSKLALKCLAILAFANIFGLVYFIIFNQIDFIPYQTLILQLIFDLVFAIIFLWLFKKEV